MNKKTVAHFYYHLHTYARTHFPRLYDVAYKRKRVLKYLISGGMATLTNLLVLYISHQFLRSVLLALIDIRFHRLHRRQF